ncbi:MAG: hypothetical protein GWN13_01800 [Phycisphaerae bacterium]|nr:hypothetical protein [Phycisphaerae bacterium]
MDKYRPGDYYIQCDYSGFKIRRSQAKKKWDGLLVDRRFWEIRHPQDFVRGIKDRQAVPDPRPEGDDTFLSTNEVTQDDL